MVCFTGLGQGCVEFPLKDSKRNYIGKTLQWIFASGKSIHNGIHIQKFAGESGLKGSYVANSYWCGINKGACGSQCGCSGGGRLSDRNDRNPDNLNRGWVSVLHIAHRWGAMLHTCTNARACTCACTALHCPRAAHNFGALCSIFLSMLTLDDFLWPCCLLLARLCLLFTGCSHWVHQRWQWRSLSPHG